MKLQVDSPVILVGIKVSNLLILNLFWVIGCLPLVTAGASTIAACTVALKMVENREGPGMTVQFWQAFVGNLKHGIPLTLIFGFGIYGAWINYQCFDKLEGNPMIFLVLVFLAAALMIAHGLFVFTLEARYENTLLMGLVNARKIFIRFFPRALGLLGILFIQLLLFTRTAPVLRYAGFFVAPILMIYTTAQVAMPIFRKLEADGMASDGFTINGGR